MCQVLIVARGFSCPLVCGIFSSLTKDQNHIPFIRKWILNHWTTREVPIIVTSMCHIGLATMVKNPPSHAGDVKDASMELQRVEHN